MRERIEDLGRIAEMLKNLLEHPLFEVRAVRNKEFLDYFDALSEDKRDDFIHSLPYRLDHVSELISEIWSIAIGDDWITNLNKPGNDQL